MANMLKPGTKVTSTGEYELYDANGKSTGKTVSMKKGDHLPPTDAEGQCYQRSKK